MNDSRLPGRRALLLACAAFTVGCGHQPGADRQGISAYDETIDALAITPDGSQLVAFGSAYHYVFRPPRTLVAALRSNLRPKLWGEFDEFEVLPYDGIRGNWTLSLPTDGLTPEDLQLARSLGFTLTADRGYVLRGTLRGTRYRGNDARPAGSTTNRPYRIRVAGPHARAPQPSPVAVDTSGLVILGLVVLLPVILLFTGSGCIPNCR